MSQRSGTHQRRDDDAARVSDAVREIGKLMRQLSELLPETGGQGPQTGVINRHAPESSEPWQAEAANAYWTMHAGIRRLANEMREERGMSPLVWRGHDDATGRVLLQIRNYSAVVSEETLGRAATALEGWVDLARQIGDIDEVERWIPVPRVPGAAPPACPYCETFSLRMALRRGEVRCFFPGCKDSEGRPTAARMEPGQATGEGILIFGDDTTMHYREEKP